MANVKNFGLIGVGENVQYGKGGSRIIDNAGTFNFKNAAGSGDVAITTAGITSSAGNVTLTTGNLAMSSAAGTLSVGGDTTLSRAGAGIFQFNGTAAVVLPSGTAAQQPSAASYEGGVRYNSDTSGMEYSDGSTWVSLATGGVAVTAVSVATANGLAGSSSGGTTPTLTLSTTVTGILKGDGTAISAAVSGTDLKTVGGNSIIGAGDVGTIGPTYGGTGLASFASGTVLYASAANTWSAAVPGATSGVQPYDTDLTALANTSTTGIYVVTGSGTSTTTSLVAPAAGFTISNPDGVAGAPTFALSDDLAAVEGISTTGLVRRTAANTWSTTTVTGTSGRIDVSNGNGVSGDPTIDLATVTNSGTGTFQKLTTDSYGRVTGTTAVVEADITAFTDSLYVNVSGDSMNSGANLTFVGGGEVLGLPSTPSGNTAATSKAYVDSLVAGLSWKQAVDVMADSNVPLTGGATLTIDSHALNNGDRVLLTNQTDPYEEGIYVVSGIGTAYTLTRSSDADTYQDLNGAAVFVQQGTVYADTGWTQTATLTSLTTGATQNWVQFSGANAYIAGSGLNLTGNTFSVNVGAGITILPTDEVGIDVEAGKAVQLTGAVSASQLTFVLDGAGITSGLTQSGAGLKIAATGVTNAMLANSGFAATADTGTDTLTLGDGLHIHGVSGQGTSVTVSETPSGTTDFAITVANASSSQKGVATFQATEFVVTSGNVQIGVIGNSNLANSSITFAGDTGSSAVALGATFTITGDGSLITTTGGGGAVDITLGTVDVAHGGTGLTTVNQYELLFGGPTNTVVQDADLQFNGGSNTLTVGSATLAGTAGGDVTLTATATNADINLIPNGTGAVIIGPSGAGLIQSDSGQPLTVRGNTFLSLESVTGDTTMLLPASTSYKVTVSGPTAAQYVTGLTDNDLVTKYYVDQAAGSTAGDIKAVSATVTLTDASTNIGAALPAGATVLSVKVNVTAADSGSGTLVVGKSGNTSAYMTAAENDTQSTGLYLAETDVTEGSSVQVIATCSGATSGTAKVIVTYQLAE